MPGHGHTTWLADFSVFNIYELCCVGMENAYFKGSDTEKKKKKKIDFSQKNSKI